MAASAVERNKAARIRRELEAEAQGGPPVAEHKKAWLEWYDVTYPGPGNRAKAEVPPFQAPPAQAPAEPGGQQSPPPPPPPPNGFASVDFGAPKASADAPPSGATDSMCGVPNCPACRSNLGARRCSATGKLVWPPMEPLAARTLAGGILGIVALIVRFVRTDKKIVVPKADEVKDLADAIMTIQRNHFTAIGAGSEFWSFIGVLGKFGHRALTEKATPTPGPVQPPPNGAS